jgi:putative hemolysin
MSIAAGFGTITYGAGTGLTTTAGAIAGQPFWSMVQIGQVVKLTLGFNSATLATGNTIVVIPHLLTLTDGSSPPQVASTHAQGIVIPASSNAANSGYSMTSVTADVTTKAITCTIALTGADSSAVRAVLVELSYVTN